eukprot:jgi/Bigna1/87779/estExt_fgenesh1_pg.C_240070
MTTGTVTNVPQLEKVSAFFVGSGVLRIFAGKVACILDTQFEFPCVGCIRCNLDCARALSAHISYAIHAYRPPPQHHSDQPVFPIPIEGPQNTRFPDAFKMAVAATIAQVFIQYLLPVFALVAGFILNFGPIPGLRKAVQRNDVGDYNPVPSAWALIQGMAVTTYGFTIGNFVVIISGAFGALCGIYVIVLVLPILVDTPKEQMVRFQNIILYGCLVQVIISLLTHHVPDAIMLMVIQIHFVGATQILYASPLSTMYAVLKERNSSSLEVPVIVGQLLCCSSWWGYAYIIGSIPILINQSIGMTLGLMMLLLRLIFPALEYKVKTRSGDESLVAQQLSAMSNLNILALRRSSLGSMKPRSRTQSQAYLGKIHESEDSNESAGIPVEGSSCCSPLRKDDPHKVSISDMASIVMDIGIVPLKSPPSAVGAKRDSKRLRRGSFRGSRTEMSSVLHLAAIKNSRNSPSRRTYPSPKSSLSSPVSAKMGEVGVISRTGKSSRVPSPLKTGQIDAAKPSILTPLQLESLKSEPALPQDRIFSFQTSVPTRAPTLFPQNTTAPGETPPASLSEVTSAHHRPSIGGPSISVPNSAMPTQQPRVTPSPARIPSMHPQAIPTPNPVPTPFPTSAMRMSVSTNHHPAQVTIPSSAPTLQPRL